VGNRVVTKNNNTLFYVNAASSPDPTQQIDYNDITGVASNTRSSHSTTISSSAPAFAGAIFKLKPNDAIADSDATQIIVMDGTPIINKHRKTCPLKVSLANGRKVTSTHMCDLNINGLLVTLTCHIILESSVASLFGIRFLTAAGCKVRFANLTCTVWYNNRIILQGGKDKATNLWTLPIGNMGMTSRQDTVVIPLVAPVLANAHAHYATTQIAFFMHTIRNKANSICFAHQLLCSPHISMLLKAIKRGYLKGCPNLTAQGISKYLNPSPATAKGHMSCPHQDIRSTQNHTNNIAPHPIKPDGRQSRYGTFDTLKVIEAL
jgi:hypothetical protein